MKVRRWIAYRLMDLFAKRPDLPCTCRIYTDATSNGAHRWVNPTCHWHYRAPDEASAQFTQDSQARAGILARLIEKRNR